MQMLLGGTVSSVLKVGVGSITFSAMGASKMMTGSCLVGSAVVDLCSWWKGYSMHTHLS